MLLLLLLVEPGQVQVPAAAVLGQVPALVVVVVVVVVVGGEPVHGKQTKRCRASARCFGK